MPLGDSFKVLGLDWFQIHFTENKGMAFGIELGGDYGKLFLSLFRIVVVGFIAYFLNKLIQKKASFLMLACISLIFAGALGNILDSIFYGVYFSDSGTFHSPRLATFMPSEGGYAGVFYGKVVDMLYFPMLEGFWPKWVPFVGGKYFMFFQPIFNIADSAISLGVFISIIFYRRFQKEVDAHNAPKTELAKEDSNNLPIAPKTLNTSSSEEDETSSKEDSKEL
ncbi:MAG: Lipoprotein signal peptidase (EC [uncultured Aureispira sp.]|uniref:Lipoprotein signal peptidase (EC) n=1 Tax=uncultured Aureispira sp. TaxID=1331704 RepID=A0A6S6THY7_9BACT|nr:MAG: Lipoprotein signal peptidase (EC [uncultured Aureispira sp.]